MALTRITKGVIKPNENYDTHNINSTGIVTAIGLDVNGNGDISGNLSVGGVLTYEDVTSIDSVGIITARNGIHVGAGVSAVGVGTFSGLDISGDIDVDGHTNLDNVSIAGVVTATTYHGNGSNLTGIDATALKDPAGNVKIQAQASGAIHTGISTFQDIDVDGHTNLDNVSVSGITTFSGIIDAVNTPASIRVAQDIQHKGDADTKITFPAADQISFETGGTNRLKLHNYSSINFVEVDASAALSLANNGSNTRYIMIGDGNASSTGSLTLQAGGGSQGFGGGITMYSHANSTNAGGVYIGKSLNSSGSIIFGNGGTGPANEYLRITSAGYLGLGTNNPARQFHQHINSSAANYHSFTNSTTGSSSSDGLLVGITQDEHAIFWHYENQPIRIATNSTERIRITSGGLVLIGTQSNRTINSHVPKLQVTGTTYSHSTVSIINNEANANGAYLFLGKQRSGAVGGSTVVQNNDIVGQLRFNVGDGTDMESYCAQIEARIDGTSGSNDVPGRLVFYTTADGSSSPTERLRIDSSGRLLLGVTDTTNAHGSFDDLIVKASDGGHAGITIVTGTSNQATIAFSDGTSGTALYNGYIQYSNNGDKLAFGAGGDDRLYIASAGQVLIGESSTSGMSAYDLGMKNNTAIRFRKADGSAWINTVGLDNSNNLKLGWGGSVDEIHFGIGGIGEVSKFNTSGNLNLFDNRKLTLGDGEDFSVSFDGTYASMHSGGNQMNIRSNRIILGDNGGVKYIDCQDNGAVSIYHQSSGTAYEQIVTGRDHISIWGTGNDASSVSYIKFKADNGSHRASIGKMSSSNGTFHIKQLDNAAMEFYTNNTLALSIGNMQNNGGHLTPGVDAALDLGSSSLRWNNVWTTDLQLSNEGKANDVDGTWGDWTLQEGEDRIFMINNRTGKKYSLIMKEE